LSSNGATLEGVKDLRISLLKLSPPPVTLSNLEGVHFQLSQSAMLGLPSGLHVPRRIKELIVKNLIGHVEKICKNKTNLHEQQARVVEHHQEDDE